MPEDHLYVRLVATAKTGREVLAKFAECRPDVTLIDLRLPDCRWSTAISH
jgi:YesN/AraC family two-component response regulator